MKPRDRGINIDDVVTRLKKQGHIIPKSTLYVWEGSFPMLKPQKSSAGERFYTEDDLAILDQIVELVKVKEHSHKYALQALKNSKSVFLQKRRAIAHLELIKKHLEDWRDTLE
jgi:DNA-binding transcriptional MerR regulator